jgi:hypothetical protein
MRFSHFADKVESFCRSDAVNSISDDDKEVLAQLQAAGVYGRLQTERDRQRAQEVSWFKMNNEK